MNRNVHMPVGVASAVVQVLTDEDPAALPTAELAGRLVGGAWGSLLPDIIDPPTYPGHRGVGHAVVPMAIAALLIIRYAPGFQDALRTQANAARARAQQLPADARWPHYLSAITYDFVLGLSTGIPIGYASHLALDATTPVGLPLLKRGY